MEITDTHIRLMLAARPSRQFTIGGSQGVFISVAGIVNLLFCGYYERYLQGEQRTSALFSLLFIECTLLTVWVARHSVSDTLPVLHRASLFDVRPASRFWFALRATALHGMSLALWGSTAIALVVLHATSPAAAFLAGAIAIALGIQVTTVTLTIILLTRRTSSASGALLFLGSVLLVFAALGSLLTWSDSILAAFPTLRWTAEGLRDARGGDLAAAGISVLLLLLPSLGAILLGRRYA